MFRFFLLLIPTLLLADPWTCRKDLILLPFAQPIEKDGHYLHSENTKPKKLIWEATCLLLPGLLDPPVRGHIKELIDRMTPHECSQELRITNVGHSTYLIQINDCNILTDPLFYSIKLGWATLFKRHVAPGISLENLPPIDIIILSHNHQDHCDIKAIEYLIKRDNPTLLLPHNVGQNFEGTNARIIEHKWGSVTHATDQEQEIHFTFLPADHWGCRGKDDACNYYWGGWMIETNGKTLYFMGDSGYNTTKFEEIRSHFPNIDIAFIPIAPENEREIHLDLDDALRATEFFNPKIMIPIHWGAIRTGMEAIEDPIDELKAALAQDFSHLKEKVHIIKIGEGYSSN